MEEQKTFLPWRCFVDVDTFRLAPSRGPRGSPLSRASAAARLVRSRGPSSARESLAAALCLPVLLLSRPDLFSIPCITCYTHTHTHTLMHNISTCTWRTYMQAQTSIQDLPIFLNMHTKKKVDKMPDR